MAVSCSKNGNVTRAYKKYTGKPFLRWEDNIKRYIQYTGCVVRCWIYLMKDSVLWEL
jgi:hypothetical protein